MEAPPSNGGASSPKATIGAVDTAKVEKLPGVLKVHRDGNFLAVIAGREYQAVVAMNALAAVGARQQGYPTDRPS